LESLFPNPNCMGFNARNSFNFFNAVFAHWKAI